MGVSATVKGAAKPFKIKDCTGATVKRAFFFIEIFSKNKYVVNGIFA